MIAPDPVSPFVPIRGVDDEIATRTASEARRIQAPRLHNFPFGQPDETCLVLAVRDHRAITRCLNHALRNTSSDFRAVGYEPSRRRSPLQHDPIIAGGIDHSVAR